MDRWTSYAKLYMDPDLHHSSGYFESDNASLSEAQASKVDTLLAKLQLRPGLKLLDVGCGWGATARAAAYRHRVRVIGLTLGENEAAYAEAEARVTACEGEKIEFRCQRWEDFDEPVDRILCVNAFENFTDKRSFFPQCRKWLKSGGRIVMLTVTADRPIFRVISKAAIIELAQNSGFEVMVSPPRSEDYARTLDCYVSNLQDNRSVAVSLIGEDVYSADIEFYSRCASFLRSGINEMYEFTFTLP